MTDSRRRILALAGHEYRSAVRSRVLIALIGILVAVTIASVYIGAVDYRSQVADYRAYLDAARAGGVQQVAPSPLRLLALLRGAMEYLEIIGAVIAITLGYLSVSRERSSRTLPLIRSRPVTPGEQAAGSTLGALGLMTTLVAVTAAVAVVCLGVIGHDWVGGGDIVKLLLAYLASIVYLMVFYALGALVTARSRVAATGLMVALGLWLVVVLILPQIGDTLDADNQVPGGLFRALTLDKPQENEVLAHFSTYESVRNGIEEASFAKHYERFVFAMTDVKEKYHGFSLGQLLDEKRNDIGWMLVYAVALGYGLQRAFRRQSTLPSGDL
jgi:ABC-type transport system involved in multi-copper enzyme maturation permease subunit